MHCQFPISSVRLVFMPLPVGGGDIMFLDCPFEIIGLCDLMNKWFTVFRSEMQLW